MHDDAGEESSLHDLSTGEYSQSSDVGHLADATVAHDASSDSSVQISNDVANWKSLFAREMDTIVLMEPQLPPKSLPKDNKSRSFPMSIFSRKMPNGETVARDWLVWSETAQSLFCFCCCLFATKSPSSTQSELSHSQLGCNDNWRKLYEKTLGHKKSSAHIVATVLFPVLGFRGQVTEHMEKKMDAMFCFCLHAEPNGSKRCRLVIVEGVQKRS